MVRIIGDVHGKFTQYADIIADCDKSIAVGDIGIGFSTFPFPEDLFMDPNHAIIPGNHDNPEVIRSLPSCVPDGTMVFDKFFCIGGAESIDKANRIEGQSWWEGEEISIEEFGNAMDRYEAAKPEIMITHDCPSDVRYIVRGGHHFYDNPSRTTQALSSFFWIHKPKIWIFGHHHIPVDEVVDGTRFICLPELGFIDI